VAVALLEQWYLLVLLLVLVLLLLPVPYWYFVLVPLLLLFLQESQIGLKLLQVGLLAHDL
jgi:hypothetical protein